LTLVGPQEHHRGREEMKGGWVEAVRGFAERNGVDLVDVPPSASLSRLLSSLPLESFTVPRLKELCGVLGVSTRVLRLKQDLIEELEGMMRACASPRCEGKVEAEVEWPRIAPPWDDKVRPTPVNVIAREEEVIEAEMLDHRITPPVRRRRMLKMEEKVVPEVSPIQPPTVEARVKEWMDTTTTPDGLPDTPPGLWQNTTPAREEIGHMLLQLPPTPAP